MSSRTIFLKNGPTERKRGKKIVLLNVIAAKKIVLLNVIAEKKIVLLAVIVLKNSDFCASEEGRGFAPVPITRRCQKNCPLYSQIVLSSFKRVPTFLHE